MRPFLLDYVAQCKNPDGTPFAVFTRGFYNLNIIGIRSSGRTANTFNDRIAVVYRDEYGFVCREWPATTDPGSFWLQNPMRAEGCAILIPGQYRGAYKLGKHRGQYDALIQTGGPVRLWRDNNRDEALDMDAASVSEPTFAGINIHRATSRTDGESGGGSQTVDRWSAGCQVFQDPDDFSAFMDLVNKSAELYGPRFTYTLIDDPFAAVA